MNTTANKMSDIVLYYVDDLVCCVATGDGSNRLVVVSQQLKMTSLRLDCDS